MPLEPLQVSLTSGEQIEVLKRFQQQYTEELEKVDGEILEILRGAAEAEFLQQYIGEQPDVVELRGDQAKLAQLQERRNHIGAILDRLAATIPQQQAVEVKAPSSMRRY